MNKALQKRVSEQGPSWPSRFWYSLEPFLDPLICCRYVVYVKDQEVAQFTGFGKNKVRTVACADYLFRLLEHRSVLQVRGWDSYPYICCFLNLEVSTTNLLEICQPFKTASEKYAIYLVLQ
ncbi:hypothetical protein DPMN_147142 [Dreissena polymorpha]|uniref:Uncharacterized protein n=1 Tax=Dreissena polymorpha TaxID=45954 RepID=A0A9D4F7U6_DREPO|nr:hypothetical protein DPMN_147142 [Dreissena polymorpha]